MNIASYTLHGLSFDCCIDKTATDPIALQVCSGGAAPLFEEAWKLSQLVEPDTALLDIGAHIGLFSLLFSARGHPVYALEASPQNVYALQENQRLNRFDRWKIYPYALSDTDGMLRFVQNGPYGFVETARTPGDLPVIEIPKIALDTWPEAKNIPKNLLIKMDIEGHEPWALKGMSRFLAERNLPPIFLESNGHCLHWGGDTPSTLCSLLISMGYAVYQVDNEWKGVRAVGPNDFQWDVVCNWLCMNPKNPPAHMPPLLPPYEEREIIAGVWRVAQHENPDQRSYLGRAIKAWPDLLRHKRVAGALFALINDPEASVRESVKWLRWASDPEACAPLSRMERWLLKMGLEDLYPRLYRWRDRCRCSLKF